MGYYTFPTERTHLSLKINVIRSRLVHFVHNLFEGRLERERPVDPDPVGERQPRTAVEASVGEDEANKLGREGVEVVDGLDLRKDSNRSSVGLPDPAAIRARTTWIEREEKTRFDSLAESCATCFPITRNTSVWLQLLVGEHG
ncbi:hypothetical protein NMG60_11024280 [Bertholletia excelsa]